jgi:hypothetical protein
MAKKNKGFGFTETPRPMNCFKCKRRFTPSIVLGFVGLCDSCKKNKKGK